MSFHFITTKFYKNSSTKAANKETAVIGNTVSELIATMNNLIQ